MVSTCISALKLKNQRFRAIGQDVDILHLEKMLLRELYSGYRLWVENECNWKDLLVLTCKDLSRTVSRFTRIPVTAEPRLI